MHFHWSIKGKMVPQVRLLLDDPRGADLMPSLSNRTEKLKAAMLKLAILCDSWPTIYRLKILDRGGRRLRLDRIKRP